MESQYQKSNNMEQTIKMGVEKWTSRLTTFPHHYYDDERLLKTGHLYFAEIQDISTLH